MSSIVIGIDLGTTNTRVGCYINGRVRILENEEGSRVTPNYVFVKERRALVVGYYAKRMAETKPEYGIYDINRLIGRKFDDPYIQKSMRFFPFTITNVDNDPVIAIKGNNGEFTVTPEEVCTAILKKIKADAGAKLGKTIDKAVITVPAYFNNSQRVATLAAANKAGFTVLKLLNEPTALALSYYLNHDTEEHYSLVYDLGGATFDVAIIKRCGTDLGIIEVDGDTYLGGNDFDNLILDHVCDYFQKNYRYNPKSSSRALRRLRSKCKEAKEMLSFSQETVMDLQLFVSDCPLVEIDLTRDQFERMAEKLFQTTIDIVDRCLKSSKLLKGDIENIILAGGSTRIPKVQQMISDHFGGKVLNKTVNPDELAAEGAALQAAMLSTNEKQRTIENFKIIDVTPLSVGIGTLADLMETCIERNTPIPVSKTLTTRTVYNQQTGIQFDVYEGERKDVKKNRLLRTVIIQGLTPAPPGQCEVSFTMRIADNGILNVTAEETFRNNVKGLTVIYATGHTSDKDVQNSPRDAEDNRLEDERFVKFALLKDFVIEYCEGVKYNLEKKLSLQVFHADKYELCEKTAALAFELPWENEKELRKLHEEVRKACDEMVANCNFECMPEFKD